MSPVGDERQVEMTAMPFRMNAMSTKISSPGDLRPMTEANIRFTVRCPKCGSKARVRHSISYVAEAFILGNPIRLHAACHDLWWDASYLERQQIRQCLIELQSLPGAESPSQHVTL
jgi:hypothetical protein